MKPYTEDYKKIREEAILAMPKGYRVVKQDEKVVEGDLSYIYDETFQEDKGKAKTWQPVSIVKDKKTKRDLSIGGNYYCCIRRVEKFSLRVFWQRVVTRIALWFAGE